jgi:hypothetical protein
MSERQLTLLLLGLAVVLGGGLVWVQFFAPCSFCRMISTVADLPARCLP